MQFVEFWGAMGYILALYVAVMMVGWKIPRRSKFLLRLVLCFVVIAIYKYSFDYFLELLPFDSTVILLIRTLDSFMLYVLSAVSVNICFECNFWATLFCSTAGYCMQHMSQRVYLIIINLVKILTDPYLNALLLCVITALFYVAIGLIFIRKSDYGGTMIDNKVQISVSFFSVLSTIFLNSFAMYAAENIKVKIYIMIFSALSAILIIYIEFGWLAAKKEAIEKGIIKHILHKSQEQYKIEKEMVEVINLKVHDMKHLFSARGGASESVLDTLNETVQTYDSFYDTGNGALNVVLTSKSLLCKKYGIQFTCLIDGEKLAFLTEEEIFSLFGNLLDNAIEAVNSIEQSEKKVISLTFRSENGYYMIHEENYCAHKLEFVNGYPKTTKKDEVYHGFGVKSISYIVKKYNGDCKITVSNDIFEIDLIFPLAEI